MKKMLLCLCVLLALLLAGCGAQDATDAPEATQVPEAAEAETAEAAEAPADAPAATEIPAAEAAEAEAPADAPAATEAPAAEAAGADASAAAPAAENPMATAQAFLIVRVGTDTVFEPIPLNAPKRLELKRGDLINIIETTQDSIWMAQSSCDNQDCIYQGTVSLENRDKRVLQNLIICLPNEVTLELYTREEIEQMLPGWLEGQV